MSNKVAAGALATYLIPGCVGRGVRLGSESSSAGGSVWKSGTWRSGNLEIWGPGNPEIWRSGDLVIQKFGVHKMEKIEILKNQIRSAQNVGKVWISRKKILLAHLGPCGPIFCVGRKNAQLSKKMHIFLGGPMGPIHLKG